MSRGELESPVVEQKGWGDFMTFFNLESRDKQNLDLFCWFGVEFGCVLGYNFVCCGL